MAAVALVFAVMAALMHVLIFVFESAWRTRPTIWQRSSNLRPTAPDSNCVTGDPLELRH